jgi:hypothetical protein
MTVAYAQVTPKRGSQRPLSCGNRATDTGSDLGFRGGAGDGNRTRITSLEGWGSSH